MHLHCAANAPRLEAAACLYACRQTPIGEPGWGASVHEVLLEQVQIVLDVCQEVLVALGARRDGPHGRAQPQLHICVGGLSLRALHSMKADQLVRTWWSSAQQHLAQMRYA